MMATDDLTVYVAWHGTDAVGTTALIVMPHITYSCHPTAFMSRCLSGKSTVAGALPG